MMDRRGHDAVLERLLHDLEDGNLSAEGWRTLEQRLIEDPEARRRYREHMAFASALHAEARAVGEIEGRPPGALAETAPRRVFGRAVLAAAAVLALLAAVASWIVIPRPEPARVVGGPDSSWHFASGGINDQGRLIEGSRVVVSSGTVEMTSTSGTRVLLEAPADFEWKRPLAGELREGQAWFAVARGDEGFTVRLGAAEVVDLGTEFGLRRHPGGDEVHVAVGSVRVGSVFENVRPVELHAGDAVAAGPTGRTRGIPCRPESFVRQLPAAVPMIRWSFDRTADRSLQAESDGPPAHALAILDDQGKAREPVLVEGRFGAALDLGASGFGARSEFAGFAGGVPRTVALWVRGMPHETFVYTPTGRDMHPSLVRWGKGEGEGGKWQLAVSADGTLVVTQWGAAWVAAVVPQEQKVLDGTWHHLASVFTGRYLDGGAPEVLHYLDGERLPVHEVAAAVPINTITDDPRSWTLSLGLQDIGPGAQPPLPDLDLDELVLLRHALDDAGVRRLFQTNEWQPVSRQDPTHQPNP